MALPPATPPDVPQDAACHDETWLCLSDSVTALIGLGCSVVLAVVVAVGFAVSAHHNTMVRIVTQAVVIACYFGSGVAFYGKFEGWEPLDTCYFLIVTMSTVGCALPSGRSPGLADHGIGWSPAGPDPLPRQLADASTEQHVAPDPPSKHACKRITTSRPMPAQMATSAPSRASASSSQSPSRCWA